MRKVVGKKKMLLVAVFLTLLAATAGVGIAITVTTFNLAGTGTLTFTDEARVISIRVVDSDKVQVKLVPGANTVANRPYTVKLFLDDTQAATGTVSWTQQEINDNAKKTLLFAGLSLSSVIAVTVDVYA
jgi:hypothetical protein